jgi:hypothetical protein
MQMRVDGANGNRIDDKRETHKAELLKVADKRWLACRRGSK